MSQETEIVIYAKVTNPDGFKEAKEITHQEQAQIRAPNGRIRVRMEKKDGAANWKYSLTTKTDFANTNGSQTCEETTTTINKDQYALFKQVCDVYLRKTRYVFQVESANFKLGNLTASFDKPTIKYEIDRFIKADGTPSEWVKIDVEIDGLKEQMTEAGLNPDLLEGLTLKLSSLPLGLQSAFVDDHSKKDKRRQLIDALYENDFMRKNLK